MKYVQRKATLNGCIRNFSGQTHDNSEYTVLVNGCENSETGTTAWACNGMSSLTLNFLAVIHLSHNFNSV